MSRDFENKKTPMFGGWEKCTKKARKHWYIRKKRGIRRVKILFLQ